ncbi:MAG: tRNA glutamyl-Q(34) synthetase GluQRS [Alphaproteobacteria bacterium]|nr:tRNA glutamyl-Q(34) synthetase GluQRS [Alphaproteobacteria bacterium]
MEISYSAPAEQRDEGPDQFPAPVTRFAPSPTGLLHLGHAKSALFAAAKARALGGRFLLRIEDIDTGRSRPEFEQAIRDDLAWLGLTWPEPVLRQSDRFPVYDKFLHLLEEADLTYPCFCTRKDIAAEIAKAPSAPHGPDGPHYPGLCKGIPWEAARERIDAGEPHAIRLHSDRAAALTGPLSFSDAEAGRVEFDPAGIGDIVLARKDVPTSYHLSVCVDDALQFVSLVTRGTDLFEATKVHRVLQSLLGLPQPAYHHHDLVLDEGGRRLAKRTGALSLRALRDQGKTPAELRAMAGFPDWEGA